MKTIKLTLTLVVMMTASLSLLESCKQDETAGPIKVTTVTTNDGTVLNGSTLVTTVPLNSAIIVQFDKEVKVATATSSNIALKANGAEVLSSITVDGSTVTLTPRDQLETGTVQTVSVTSGLQAKDGGSATVTDVDFKTIGKAKVTPPQPASQLSYFAFSGNVNDGVGAHTPAAADIRDLTYTTDRFGFPGLAGNFNGTTTIVEIPNGDQYLANKSLTVSFWVKASSAKSGHFVLGLAGWKGFYFEIASDWSYAKFPTQYAELSGLSDYEDNLFLGTGETNQDTGWQGWTFQKNVQPLGVGATYFKDKWAHVVCTYDASSKLATMYINGEKVKQHDFNLWPNGDPKKSISGVKFAGNLTGGGNKLALGFIQGSQNRAIADSWADPADTYSSHFQGQLDDVRIFKVALSETEVSALFNDEKPQQ